MAFVTDSNRPQPLWHPPPTASGAASEVPCLLMHRCCWPRLAHTGQVTRRSGLKHPSGCRWTKGGGGLFVHRGVRGSRGVSAWHNYKHRPDMPQWHFGICNATYADVEQTVMSRIGKKKNRYNRSTGVCNRTQVQKRDRTGPQVFRYKSRGRQDLRMTRPQSAWGGGQGRGLWIFAA